MVPLHIAGGRVLLESGLTETDLRVADGLIAAPESGEGTCLDAQGLLVLPGIIDLHGDAFERQLQPRPGIAFPTSLAIADTEAQLLANGITTAYHGVTLSWEPGLRGIETWRALLAALDAHRPRQVCDMRVHLRWEAYNLDCLDEAVADIGSGRVGLVAFNDHTPGIVRKLEEPSGISFSKRAGMGKAAFRELAHGVLRHKGGLGQGLARIAEAARQAGLPMASHDDPSVAMRDGFRKHGVRICEFPMAEEVGRAAREADDAVVMGAPNVVRGGSHMGWASAARLVGNGICNVLASDYFYPAMLQAAFVLAGQNDLGLAAAWRLVSTNPAAAAGLTDRGCIAVGARADLVLVDANGPAPRPVVTIAAGRVAWLSADGWARLGTIQAASLTRNVTAPWP